MLTSKNRKIKKLLKTAKSLSDQKKYFEAIVIFKNIIALDPAHGEAYFYLGVAFTEIEDHEAMIGAYEKCIEAGVGDFPGYAYYNLGYFFSESDRPLEALPCYLKSAEIVPDFFMLQSALGRVYLSLGQYDDAVASFNKVLEIRPDLPDGYSLLGLVYCRQGYYQEAIDVCRQALKISPDDIEIYKQIVAAYYHLKQYDNAVIVSKKVLELDPQDKQTISNLQVIYSEMEEG